MTCVHEAFDAKVEVERIADDSTGEIRNFIAEVSIRCTQCNEPFHFIGLPAGLSFKRPTVNVGATTLRAPVGPGELAPPARMRFEVS